MEDKTMNNRVKTILATVENKSTVLPATNQIEQVEKAAKEIINQKIKENQTVQKEIQNYDTFIEKLKKNQVVLVNNTTVTANLKTPILTIDSTTKTMLQAQENPTKTYLDLNKKMVQ
jgi:Rieske Fe-S protein